MKKEEFELIFEKVTFEVLVDIDKDKASYEDSILDLGISSLVFIKLIVSYEEAFSIEFDVEDLDFQMYKILNDLKDKVQDLNSKSRRI